MVRNGDHQTFPRYLEVYCSLSPLGKRDLLGLTVELPLLFCFSSLFTCSLSTKKKSSGVYNNSYSQNQFLVPPGKLQGFQVAPAAFQTLSLQQGIHLTLQTSDPLLHTFSLLESFKTYCRNFISSEILLPPLSTQPSSQRFEAVTTWKPVPCNPENWSHTRRYLMPLTLEIFFKTWRGNRLQVSPGTRCRNLGKQVVGTPKSMLRGLTSPYSLLTSST